ncbi:MAG TPA: lipopolysaccharide heptosyltransferase II [Candidatus Saccharimonadales bacterium]|nr:lipopolysaccharide heptosyltransferase II [Candidatus Saccharimonadales bacterium]
MSRLRSLHSSELRHAKIVIRVPNWIGDAVMTLPALRALRAALPEAEVTLLARPWVRDVYPLSELHFTVLDYDSQTTHGGIKGRLKIVNELKKQRFDLALLFQNAFDAALIAWMARIPIRAGYGRDGRHFLLTHSVDVPQPGEIPAHESHYYLELLRRLGLIPTYEQVREISLRPSLPGDGPSSDLRRRLREMGASEKLDKIIGLSPGASFGTAKRWPADRFADLVKKLDSELNATCVLFGSSQEARLAEEIVEKSHARAFSLAGKTNLAMFTNLVSGCNVYVTNDTGTMHVAAALGVPTVAIFGPTDERGTAPLGPSVEIVLGVADCRPCKLRHCPYGHHNCMVSISPDMVMNRIRQSLGD